MKPMRPVAAPTAPSRPVKTGWPGARWSPDVADPMMDPVDRVVGLAFFDPAFRAALLTNPAAALAPEPMPLAVKRALVSIHASSVEEFARRAVEPARPGRRPRRPTAGRRSNRRTWAPWPAPEVDPPPAPHLPHPHPDRCVRGCFGVSPARARSVGPPDEQPAPARRRRGRPARRECARQGPAARRAAGYRQSARSARRRRHGRPARAARAPRRHRWGKRAVTP
jgi:hypothetical protein